MNSARQLHWALLPWARHSALAPHGDGWHGSIGSCLTGGGGWRWQATYAFPVKDPMQWQFGLWLITRHSALRPQVPGQGSRQCCWRQAKCSGHSALLTHSGRHEGGIPTKSRRHEHTACPLILRHWAFGPHGEGWQGSTTSRIGAGGKGRHWLKAFPVIPGGQWHMATCLCTSHMALDPHLPGQGSTHLFLTHALFQSHSVLSTHSGRHPTNGLPTNSGRQLHCPWLQTALGPQVIKEQGSLICGGSRTTGGGAWQDEKALPISPGAHWQVGLWLITVHRALKPQAPGQGSRQRCCWQARWAGQSGFMVHSGRQLGGVPK